MFNAASMIAACLDPIVCMRSRGEVREILVIDDGSTDASPEIVRRYECIQLVRMDRQSGPAAARNRGAELATGTYVWFVDSDVIVAEDAARVLSSTLTRTSAAAVLGSYDEQPGAKNFLSQYKNLVHHYYHHRGKEKASTFWAGCGAVNRDLFLRVGGFDAGRYRYPSIEDIELGYRISDLGYPIFLERRLQGKHLKEWRFMNLIHTEIFRRALPWSRLMLERRTVTDDLNVGIGERARAALTLSTVGVAIGMALGVVGGWVTAAFVALLVVANWNLIGFFSRTRGPVFAMRAFLFHQLYYAYSSAAFVAATSEHYLGRSRAFICRSG